MYEEQHNENTSNSSSYYDSNIGSRGNNSDINTISICLFKEERSHDNNGNNSKNGNTVTIEECKNRGSASGFDTAVDQECENLICTHPGNNATCVSEGRAAATVVAQTANLTCEQCITKFLTPQHIQRLFGILDDFPHTLENLCPVLHGIATEQEFRQLLDDIGFSQPGLQDRLLSCLSKAGALFFEF
jgi:hypothetical protein